MAFSDYFQCKARKGHCLAPNGVFKEVFLCREGIGREQSLVEQIQISGSGGGPGAAMNAQFAVDVAGVFLDRL